MIAALLIGDLFAAGEVAFIMEIGALLEDMTTERAKKGLKALISLTPETGRVIRDGVETTVPVSEVQKGDLLRIQPGETIPVDGKIVAGETSVDQSVMTGESLPVDKAPGDTVFSGTINRFGSIDMRATKVGEDSSLQKLIRMVENAEKNQAPSQRIADKWASWLVPIALLIAVSAYLVTGDIVRAVTVLVVFCPCALVLATPTAIMAAIGQATKHGVIIKSGEALEAMGKVDRIAFDKTGTLTFGRLEVSDIFPVTDISLQELLTIAASAERRSEHPLGKAITEKANEEGCTLFEASDFRRQYENRIMFVPLARPTKAGFFMQAGKEESTSPVPTSTKLSPNAAKAVPLLPPLAISVAHGSTASMTTDSGTTPTSLWCRS